jgi:hypothetical protein
MTDTELGVIDAKFDLVESSLNLTMQKAPRAPADDWEETRSDVT